MDNEKEIKTEKTEDDSTILQQERRAQAQRFRNWVAKVQFPATADFHVHLRDGVMMETVVPTIRSGGVNLVYVMVRSLSLNDWFFKRLHVQYHEE